VSRIPKGENAFEAENIGLRCKLDIPLASLLVETGLARADEVIE
jgi:hypothetical protein